MIGRSTSQVGELRREVAELRTAYAQLQAAHAELQAAHLEVEAAHAELRATHEALLERALAAEEMVRVLQGKREQQAQVMAAMNAELETLKRHVFGKRSEKTPPVSQEVKKGNGGNPADAEAAAQRRKQNREARKNLPTWCLRTKPRWGCRRSLVPARPARAASGRSSPTS